MSLIGSYTKALSSYPKHPSKKAELKMVWQLGLVDARAAQVGSAAATLLATKRQVSA